MANIVVVGSQWGDEGKGKIVDWLAEKADVVVRFQGGHNAGHTLVVDADVYKLNLLPSGVLWPDKSSIIGNGVVVDPQSLLNEIKELRTRGVAIDEHNLHIAENVVLILPVHQELDAMRENHPDGYLRIGTTMRGIGPAYEDKVGRRAIRLIDLADLGSLSGKLECLLKHHNALRASFGRPEVKVGDVFSELSRQADSLLPFMKPVWRLLLEYQARGASILFEGAQGTMLDVDHGTYPFVTSSNTVAAQAAVGTGIGPGFVDYVLGITKTYTTRVGEGCFPTEQTGEVGEILSVRGHEWGSVTGRERRCGWFDAVLVRQSVHLSGINGLALTKLDVLDGLDEIRICVGYRLDGEDIDYLPAERGMQERLEPVYETLEGWKSATAGVRRWDALPQRAQDYVHRIEELTGVPVAAVSTGAERKDVVAIAEPFAVHSG